VAGLGVPVVLPLAHDRPRPMKTVVVALVGMLSSPASAASSADLGHHAISRVAATAITRYCGGLWGRDNPIWTLNTTCPRGRYIVRTYLSNRACERSRNAPRAACRVADFRCRRWLIARWRMRVWCTSGANRAIEHHYWVI
jgi:hypothetical protein